MLLFISTFHYTVGCDIFYEWYISFWLNLLCLCYIILGANHFSWSVFLNKFAAFHDLNSHMSILWHQYLFQMLGICIHDIWERFCVAKINITYFTSKNSSKRFSFFVIHFYIQFWLVTKYCRISCGELLTQSSEG